MKSKKGEMAIVGLGRMGMGMTKRLIKKGNRVIVWNRSREFVNEAERYGAIGSNSFSDMFGKFESGRKIVWLMLPAGKVTDNVMKEILPFLKKEDIIIDGANDFYKNAEKHNKLFKKKGVYFYDCGVSGGVWGLKNGYTLMIGGSKKKFRLIEKFCKDLAPKGGYGYFGPVGSGHFVKSVHNIVEYVYLQGLAEGVELLSKFKHEIRLEKVTSVWEPASVIRSWLLELTTKALKRSDFKKILAEIGSATMDELLATKKSVKGFAPAFDVAVKVRKDRSKKFNLGKKTIAAVRNEFGGHAVKKK